MDKLLKIALILGLIKAFQSKAVEYPPLPLAPGKSPVDAPGIPARSLSAEWDVTAACRDVLEISNRADFGTHADMKGPYEVRDIAGISCYHVPLPVGYAESFFRVRRVWGNPWVL
jgi:hypothetical protein